MKKIYSNFDGLDIAFQGKVPQDIMDQLADAKEKVMLGHTDEQVKLGKSKLSVTVHSTGANGYSYVFDTGMDREKWFIKKATSAKQWSIYVSVKSLSLALYGYEGVKKNLLNVLGALEVQGAGRHDPVTGKFTDSPLESISRFDYCVDFMAQDFEPDVKNFVTHSSTTKQIYGEKVQDVSTTERGKFVETVRIGKMPSKQATIYNKTKEIIKSNKSYWWDIWELDKESLISEIWRVEIRAGKDELKKWNTRTFRSFEENAGNIAEHILKCIRYTVPNRNDKNITRWPLHEIWAKTLQTVNEEMLVYKSQEAKRDDIIQGYRHEKIFAYQKQLTGLAVSFVALLGAKLEDIPEVMHQIALEMKDELKGSQFHKLQEKYEKAIERFAMLS